MPPPAAPTRNEIGDVVVALFRQMHEQVRREIAGLDDKTLNWQPTSGANSIATVIKHLVGSEAETVRVAAGVPCERDRDSEFAPGDACRADVLRLLDEADLLLDNAAPSLEARLWELAALPTLPAEELRPVVTWLIANYGHAREHVGHLQLTRELQRADARRNH